MKGLVFFFLLFFVCQAKETPPWNHHIMVRDNQLTALQCQDILNGIPPGVNDINISAEPIWQALDKVLIELVGDAIGAYASPYIQKSFPRITNDTGYHLLRYGKDSAAAQSGTWFLSPYQCAQLSLVVFLNSDVTGGAWQFPRQKDYTINPECGRVIVFPSSFTHPYVIKNITNGTLSFIVTWMK